ncbi:hypothetical protein D3C83_203440 [compost metagenome]
MIVKPGGTGKPMRHISARFAPLPPSSGFICPWPSALPPPKEYTYFVFFAVAFAAVFFEVVFTDFFTGFFTAFFFVAIYV